MAPQSACVGYGKIQHPEPILNQHLTPEECWDAVDECGAPVVSIARGEPLVHPQIDKSVEGLAARKKYAYLYTNAILLDRWLPTLKPTKYPTVGLQMDGMGELHDQVCSIKQLPACAKQSASASQGNRRASRPGSESRCQYSVAPLAVPRRARTGARLCLMMLRGAPPSRFSTAERGFSIAVSDSSSERMATTPENRLGYPSGHRFEP